jgi:hypothetical protein
MKNLKLRLAILLLSILCLLPSAYAQFTPSGDAYTNSADPATKYGANALLDVDGATQKTYIQFNLSSIPTGASISQATLKLYVNAVTTAGSFEVYTVGASWSESTIDYTNEPALGSVINSGVALVAADKNQYILIPITSTVQGWVKGSVANNGIALVAIGALNTSFDSKESTSTSHPPELDIVFAGAGTVTSVGTGTGLTGGPITGSGTISLLTSCSTNQILQWNGTAWMCATASSGTVTSVASGAGLSGGPITGTGTLSLAAYGPCASGSALTAVPFTCSPFATLGANAFTGTQTITGKIALPHTNSAGTQGLITFGGVPFVHDYGISGSYNSFFGFSAGNLTNTGKYLTAVGDYALYKDTTGSNNTALGYSAGTANTNGNSNTFIGYLANAGIAGLTNATAIGANAVVSQNNSLVLGATGVKVGIGTAAPAYTLDVQGTGNFAGAVTFASGQTFPGLAQLGTDNTFTAPQTITAATGNALSATSSNSSGSAVYALNTAATGINGGLVAQATSPQSSGVSGIGGYFGVTGNVNTSAAGAAAVYGISNGMTGQTMGVYGLNYSTTDGAAGVIGNAIGSSGRTYGVFGENANLAGIGVFGLGVNPSVTGIGSGAHGVWGDTEGVNGSGAGVAGSAGDGAGGEFYNNSNSVPTLYVYNLGSGGTTGSGVKQSPLLLEAYGGNTGKGCTIDVGGTLNCDGTVAAVVPTDSGARKVSLYSVQSPENWFEDASSGQLINGSAHIDLDPTFAQTVNSGIEYHVFLTPKGDSEGLYVSNETPQGFEVHEQHNGRSNIAFDYRIMAKRIGYENVRLADLTEQTRKQEAERSMRRPVHPSAKPQSGQVTSTPAVRAEDQPVVVQPK